MSVQQYITPHLFPVPTGLLENMRSTSQYLPLRKWLFTSRLYLCLCGWEENGEWAHLFLPRVYNFIFQLK